MFTYLWLDDKAPSLIRFMVSVDVKHHVYILTSKDTTRLPKSRGAWGGTQYKLPKDYEYVGHFSPKAPSLISLMVSVDVKHHVYLLTSKDITDTTS